MQALETAINRKIAGRPASRTKCERFVDQRFRYRGEDEHRPANDTARDALADRPLALPSHPDARLGRPHQQPACARHASRHRAPARRRPRGPRHGARLRPDARAVRATSGSSTRAIGRHRGGRLLAKARGPRLALAGARPLGAARQPRASTSRSATAPTTSASPPRCCAIPSSTMFDYEWATVQHNVNCRLARAVVVPDAIPPERLARYGAGRKLRALRGPQGGVLPRRLRARPTLSCDELGLDRSRADRGRAHPARGLPLPPLRERRCSPPCSSGCARPPSAKECSPSCCPASPPSAPS